MSSTPPKRLRSSPENGSAPPKTMGVMPPCAASACASASTASNTPPPSRDARAVKRPSPSGLRFVSPPVISPDPNLVYFARQGQDNSRSIEHKMTATDYVATWMYVESPQEGGLYPQVGGLSTSQATQNIYWRCVYTFFWSAARFAKRDGVKFLLFTNVSELPVVDG